MRDKNTEESWCHFKVLINRLVEKHIPKKKFKSNNRPRKPLWMNDKALAALKKKREAFKRYLQTKEGIDYQNYAKLRRQLNTIVKISQLDRKRTAHHFDIRIVAKG